MSTLVVTTVTDVKARWLRVVIAAIVATVVLEFVSRVIAPQILGFAFRPAFLVCQALDVVGLKPASNCMNTAGEAGHLLSALVFFPLAYLLLMHPVSQVPAWAKGLFWGLVLWAVAMGVLNPIVGSPAFLGWGKITWFSLAAHLAYGVVLGAVIGNRRAAG